MPPAMNATFWPETASRELSFSRKAPICEVQAPTLPTDIEEEMEAVPSTPTSDPLRSPTNGLRETMHNVLASGVGEHGLVASLPFARELVERELARLREIHEQEIPGRIDGRPEGS
jgi:hypothetical protein